MTQKHNLRIHLQQSSQNLRLQHRTNLKIGFGLRDETTACEKGKSENLARLAERTGAEERAKKI
jgi:hypothetical protein